MRAATEGQLPPVMPQGNLVEVLGQEVRQRSPGELMVESSPSRERRPPCRTSKEMSDEAADAAALTYLLTEVGERWGVSIPNIDMDVVWCGPYKVLEVLNKGEKVKLDISAPFDWLRVFNRDSIKPYIHLKGQPVWELPMPPVKTEGSPRLVKIMGRRRSFLYGSGWDDDTWSGESGKALEEGPVYLEFLGLQPA